MLSYFYKAQGNKVQKLQALTILVIGFSGLFQRTVKKDTDKIRICVIEIQVFPTGLCKKDTS